MQELLDELELESESVAKGKYGPVTYRPNNDVGSELRLKKGNKVLHIKSLGHRNKIGTLVHVEVPTTAFTLLSYLAYRKVLDYEGEQELTFEEKMNIPIENDSIRLAGHVWLLYPNGDSDSEFDKRSKKKQEELKNEWRKMSGDEKWKGAMHKSHIHDAKAQSKELQETALSSVMELFWEQALNGASENLKYQASYKNTRFHDPLVLALGGSVTLDEKTLDAHIAKVLEYNSKNVNELQVRLGNAKWKDKKGKIVPDTAVENMKSSSAKKISVAEKAQERVLDSIRLQVYKQHFFEDIGCKRAAERHRKTIEKWGKYILFKDGLQLGADDIFIQLTGERKEWSEEQKTHYSKYAEEVLEKQAPKIRNTYVQHAKRECEFFLQEELEKNRADYDAYRKEQADIRKAHEDGPMPKGYTKQLGEKYPGWVKYKEIEKRIVKEKEKTKKNFNIILEKIETRLLLRLEKDEIDLF